MLYFSYGSNMSSRRLLSRVPSARFITSASLPGHALHFHKKGLDGSAKCDAYETKSHTFGISTMCSLVHWNMIYLRHI